MVLRYDSGIKDMIMWCSNGIAVIFYRVEVNSWYTLYKAHCTVIYGRWQRNIVRGETIKSHRVCLCKPILLRVITISLHVSIVTDIMENFTSYCLFHSEKEFARFILFSSFVFSLIINIYVHTRKIGREFVFYYITYTH